jgi:thiamine-phosphate pyrophosphorylase
MWQLYIIIDHAALAGRDPAETAAAAIRGGADALQLRHKGADDEVLAQDAGRLLPLTRAAGIPLIVNDSVEAAVRSGADGVHLGQDDLSIAEARARLGANRLIGRSTHTPEQARAAQAEGADYIGFGPIFPTPTKPTYGPIGPDAIREAAALVTIPMVCIGGIDAATLPRALAAGARCVAVVRAVCAAPDPEAAVRRLRAIIQRRHGGRTPAHVL